MSAHTEGYAQIYIEETPTPDDAKREFARLVDGTPEFTGQVVHVVIDNGPPSESLCIAAAGCGSAGLANASHLALCWNMHGPLVEFISKFEMYCPAGINDDLDDLRREAIDFLTRIKEQKS